MKVIVLLTSKGLSCSHELLCCKQGLPQEKVSSSDQSPGSINGIPSKKQGGSSFVEDIPYYEKEPRNAAHLNEPKFQESLNEDSLYDEKETQNTDPKSPKSGRKLKSKKVIKKRKKPKKTGLFGGLLTFRTLLILYIFGVFFVCHGKSRKQCSYAAEFFCYNGISQYILTHDWFHKYIEPGVIEIKRYSADYGKQALVTYEVHAKPHIDPYIESAQPYIQRAKELSVEFIYNPAAEGSIKVQEFYSQNAKDSVDTFYEKARKTVTPYLNNAQNQVNYAYEKLISYNKKKIQPWYYHKFIPFVVKSKENAIAKYNEKVAPYVNQLVKTANENYHKHIVPFYNTNIKPHVEYCIKAIMELVQGEDENKKKTDIKAKKEAERKAKEEAERKAKEEAKRKAKEEAERKAKEEAERKAKKEAERKAKEEAERKAKEEAERKAKEEAERKAKEEVELKAKEEAEHKAKEEAERKAKEEAERKAKEEAEKAAAIKAVRDTAAIGISRARENISIALKDYELKAKSAVKETSDDTEAKIISLNKLGTDYPSKLTKFVDELAKDTEKNITIKIDKISEYAKQTIDTIKTNLKKADESLDTLNEKVNELEKDFVLIINSNMNGIKSNAHSKAGKITIDQKIYDEVDRDINITSQNVTAEFNSSTLRIKEEIKGIEIKITSLKSTARSVVQDIVNSTKITTLTLKQRDALISQNVDNKSSSLKGSEIESDKVPQFVVQTSSDPVLDKLKLQFRSRDPVLQKLKDEYQKSPKNKQSGKVAKDGSY
ncbi:25190_t:CDS:2 [Cetraspora pellucida]|uniref:25190_t:CDS:1 n=1 Tax=Cetraspora pellucida TaxID=1433469 RepID=A0A9N9CQS5_9GLOM|nr:25190_t:CDS:2 [Cetraspora pellucida]